MDDSILSQIMDYESGNMDSDDVVPFFGRLVASGLVCSLQGSYQREAQRLIDAGRLDTAGNVLEN